MNEVNELIIWFRGLLLASAVPRVVYCLVKMAMDNEQSSMYKRRMIHAIIFVAIAQVFVTFLRILKHYYL